MPRAELTSIAAPASKVRLEFPKTRSAAANGFAVAPFENRPQERAGRAAADSTTQFR
jgi:hypothetical protein